ncbi:MAG: calcium-binding protein [Nocardioides sp.]
MFGDPIFQSLSGGPGADTVVGGRGPDEVFGGAGADMLIGNAGADFMNGGDGRDTLRGGLGRDNLNGNRRSDRIFGGRDGDFIEDPDGANAVMGGAGVDFIGSGPGDEAIDGGTGRDLVSYAEVLSGGGSSSHCHAITVDLSKGSASGAGFGADALHHVETVLTGGGSDVLIGDAAANGFYAGFPCFRGRSPTESVTGKGGADRVYFSEPLGGEGSSGRVLVDLQDHAAQLGNQGAAPVLYTLRSVENVTGTDLRDVILGNAGPNRLDGGPSNSGDVINGRRGDDVLIGNGGADQLDGGTGRNRNDGGNGIDTCLRPSEGALAINCEQ